MSFRTPPSSRGVRARGSASSSKDSDINVGGNIKNQVVKLGQTYKINSNEQDNSVESSYCKECNKLVRKQDKGIQCDMCTRWYHAKCGKVGNEAYAAIGNTEGIDWYCIRCKEETKQLREKLGEAVHERNLLREENRLLKEKLEVLESKIDEVRQDIKTEILSEVDGKIDKYFEEMKEREDKRSKECNLVLFNVTESSRTHGKDRENDDMVVCDKIFQEGVGVDNYKIESLFRLGKKSSDSNNVESNPRPLLVKFANVSQKWQILKNAKNLNKCRDDLKKCSIAPDLTKKERELDQKLRAELKEKRLKRDQGDSGEVGWTIKNGKVVKKNF